METQKKYEVLAPLDIQELTDVNLETMREELLFIPEVPENKEQYIIAKTINISVKKILPRIEERRKEIKAPHLEKCREIDALAKDAVALVQPIIDMSAERRAAWEAEIEAHKEAERAAEQARLDVILNLMKELKSRCERCLEYGIDAEDIQSRIIGLASCLTTTELFQEFFEEAEKIKADGLLTAKIALENRLKFEAEQAELEAQKKAQAKIDAANKAEADRLVKIQAEQDEAALEARKAQEEAARKLESDRKAFEAEKAALDQAEYERKLAEEKRLEEQAEVERIGLRDELWAEALPIHIWEYVYPVAVEANRQFDDIQDRHQILTERTKHNLGIIKQRNIVDTMTRNIMDTIQQAKDNLEWVEFMEIVEFYERYVVTATAALNESMMEVE